MKTVNDKDRWFYRILYLPVWLTCMTTEYNFPRFKYVVQVVIGEQRGEGVRYFTSYGAAAMNNCKEEALTVLVCL